MSKRDYYETLGLSKGASEAEIKKGFRKKAMELHPDRNQDDPTAEDKFKEANEAYDVLKDGDKKAAYDQYGHAAFEGGMGGGGGRSPFGGGGGGDFNSAFSDVFDDLFGNFGGGQRGGPAGASRGSDLRYNLKVSLNDAYNGKQEKVSVNSSVSCDGWSTFLFRSRSRWPYITPSVMSVSTIVPVGGVTLLAERKKVRRKSAVSCAT